MQQKRSKNTDRCHVGAAAVTVLVVAALSGCGEAEQAKSSPVPVVPRTFDQLIADMHCMSCHLPGNKMGAPSWKDVAKKYKAEKAEVVEARLANKIGKGGSGAWGRMDMPPNRELKPAELKVLAQGILQVGSATAKSPAVAQKK
jgi:cytochrome c